MKLHIGTTAEPDDFNLPLDLVTQTVAILAKKGAGKSYTASVMVEQLLDAGQIPVIIDPTGAWWGLKSSADGKHAAYPMVVFGGEHADLPLEEHAGEATARAIVEQRFPAIIDLSLFRKNQVKRFITPFLETLYRLNRLPLMLVVDEADDICPQKPFGDEAQMVGALEDVVKRGRKKGIGCTLITQRPADLAKQVLTQCEMLVAMRLTHPLDIKAVMEWVNVHADPKPAAAMVESLPSLPIGTAWFWSPGWGDIFERVKVARRRTFDSGATPKAGETAITPKQMAQPDLTKIGSEIMASVERAKADDPKILKARIAQLEREVKTAQPVIKTEVREVTIFDDRSRAKLAEMVQLTKEANERGVHIVKQLDRLNQEIAIRIQASREKLQIIAPTPSLRVIGPRRHDVPLDTPRRQVVARYERTNNSDLPPGERKILTALADHRNGLTREQLTVLCGYKRSSRDAYVQRLMGRGYAENVRGVIVATESGVDALGSNYQPLPTGTALREHYLNTLPDGERNILAFLIGKGGTVAREAIDEGCGYKRSSRDAYLQRLKSRELIETNRDGVSVSAHLF